LFAKQKLEFVFFALESVFFVRGREKATQEFL